MVETGTQYCVATDVSFERLGEETVLVSFRHGAYFGLDEIATLIWTTLAAGGSVQTAVDAISREYDVDPEKAGRDALALIDKWIDMKLLTARKDPSQSPGPEN